VRFVVLLLLFGTFFKTVFANTNDGEYFSASYMDPACVLITPTDGEKPVSKLSSKYIRPLSSRVIECLDGTLTNLFIKPDPRSKMTIFQQFQAVVKPMVILVLILYIAFNGYLVATGQMFKEKPKQEILMFILKFILVFYFAIGDAWKDFFFLALRSISTTLGAILIEAGANTVGDGCIFTGIGSTPYPDGKGYIAIFDSLDCKIANYIGWFAGVKFPILVPMGITFFFAHQVGSFLFSLVLTLVFQLFTIVLRVCNFYILSIIMLTILIYASPIIVPMVLFQSTKNMFDKWLNKVIGLCVHPVVLFAFIGIILSITDRVYYGANPDGNELFLPPRVFAAPAPGTISINYDSYAKRLRAKGRTEQAINNRIAEIKQSFGNGSVSFNNPDGSISYTFKPNNESVGGNQGGASLGLSGEALALAPILGPLGTAVSGTLMSIAKELEVTLTQAFRNPNAVEGAEPNPKCHGGDGITKFDTPLVCVMAWLYGSFSVISLPIPNFLELIDIYIPYRLDLGLLFFVIVFFCCIINYILGTIFESLEGVIDSISGVSLSGLVTAPTMKQATEAGMRGFDQMKSAQESVLQRGSEMGGGGEKQDSSSSEKVNLGSASQQDSSEKVSLGSASQKDPSPQQDSSEKINLGSASQKDPS
jgi:hypothetical protein